MKRLQVSFALLALVVFAGCGGGSDSPTASLTSQEKPAVDGKTAPRSSGLRRVSPASRSRGGSRRRERGEGKRSAPARKDHGRQRAAVVAAIGGLLHQHPHRKPSKKEGPAVATLLKHAKEAGIEVTEESGGGNSSGGAGENGPQILDELVEKIKAGK